MPDEKRKRKPPRRLKKPNDEEREEIRRRQRERSLGKTQKLASPNFKLSDTGVFDTAMIDRIQREMDAEREKRYRAAKNTKIVKVKTLPDLSENEYKKKLERFAKNWKSSKTIKRGVYFLKDGKLHTIMSGGKPRSCLWNIVMFPLVLTGMAVCFVFLFVLFVLVVELIKRG